MYISEGIEDFIESLKAVVRKRRPRIIDFIWSDLLNLRAIFQQKKLPQN